MIISVRAVLNPRKWRDCNECGTKFCGPHLYYFGAAHDGDKPYPLIMCESCALTRADMNLIDNKALSAVEKLSAGRSALAEKERQSNV